MSEMKDKQSGNRSLQQNVKKIQVNKQDASRHSNIPSDRDQLILFSSQIQCPSNKNYQSGEVQVVTKEVHSNRNQGQINFSQNLLQDQHSSQNQLVKYEGGQQQQNQVQEAEDNQSQQQQDEQQQQGSNDNDEQSEEDQSSSPIVPAIKTMQFRKVRGERIKDMISGKIKITDGHLAHKVNEYLGVKIKKKNKKIKQKEQQKVDKEKNQSGEESLYNYNQQDSSDQQDYVQSSSGRDEFDSDFDLTDSYPGKRGRKKGSKVKKNKISGRGRGRPRLQHSSDKNQRQQSGIKKKRGRPPKIRPEGSQPYRPKPVLNPALPPQLGGPKRRGRPRKYPIISQQTIKSKKEQIQRRFDANTEKKEEIERQLEQQPNGFENKSNGKYNMIKTDQNYFMNQGFSQNFMGMNQFMPGHLMNNLSSMRNMGNIGNMGNMGINMFYNPFENGQMGMQMMRYGTENEQKSQNQEQQQNNN